MPTSKKQLSTEETFTAVVLVVACADATQIAQIMNLCGIARALTYNKLGSRQGWDLDWKKADRIVRTILKPSDIRLPAKLWEWSVNDTMKAISAQQQAAKVFLIRAIWQRHPLQAPERNRALWLEENGSSRCYEAWQLFPECSIEQERNRLFNLLHRDPTADPWLHRQFRHQYQRGHTFVRNQIVYQYNGYTCKRLTRNTIQLLVQGLEKGKRIALKLKCRHIISGQIRLIRNSEGDLEVHCTRKRTLILPDGKATEQIGIDKGYTEAFYTSNGDAIAAGLGWLMTEKTERIARTNRNRYRLRSHAPNNPEKAAAILKNNLGYKVKSRRLAREKATIQNFLRKDLRRIITEPMQIFAEDLSSPIKRKQQAKRINRKLNQWMKGELQASLEKISLETGSTLSVVNPSYTSQMDSLTGTLLGQRDGDRFIRYTGDVIQADKNAALNILHRGSNAEITRWMKHAQVRKTLIMRTVRYLASIGKTVSEALSLNWLSCKFRAEALSLEAEYHRQG